MANSPNNTPALESQHAKSEEAYRHALFDLEPGINNLFGASVALNTFAEKAFARDSARRDEQGRLEYVLEADEKEALFFLLYQINDNARAVYAGFHDGAAAAKAVQS